ncbi:LOW QUALITY PROTEIN: antigen-presenting glycoprotein CD1d [Camelus ferus]|uniref:LOW QUALITY PROTEIN: antigen-presenting glycoprotein CD1d n=2 Tax=Camelus TaxID=9836 RepID=A0A8B8RQ08_CAMFR|nr:antigen-presenting glycoprotein CD1d [Camelus bactrianus]XP_032319852.1 LOW QUALITY PROTEIN: antigen-presenting glycoprotein CD1d [Camelus ferus]
MGCLLFLLLWGLPQIRGSSEGPQRHFPLRCLQISSFANSSWSRTDGLAWLGELQAYTWRNDSDTIRFLKPWSQGRFSDQQWENLQHIFLVYRISFTRDIQEFVTMLHVDYPFDIQISGGCEVLLGNTSKSFLDIAFQGKAVVSFQGTFWVPDPDSPPWVQKACKVANQDRGTRETVQWLLDSICPGLVRGLLETGKSELEKPVQPEAWLSSGPAPGPGRLLLGCHVSGFYPNPVWAMWMRGEQEQPGTRRGDVLPQADGTWYLRVTLDVAAGEAAGLSCRVRHSSLGDQDIILYWGRGQASPGLIAGLVVAFLLILTCVGLAFCCQRRRRYHGIM